MPRQSNDSHWPGAVELRRVGSGRGEGEAVFVSRGKYPLAIATDVSPRHYGNTFNGMPFGYSIRLELILNPRVLTLMPATRLTPMSSSRASRSGGFIAALTRSCAGLPSATLQMCVPAISRRERRDCQRHGWRQLDRHRLDDDGQLGRYLHCSTAYLNCPVPLLHSRARPFDGVCRRLD